MEFKIKVIKFHPNFKGKILNYNSLIKDNEFSFQDLKFLYLKGFIAIWLKNGESFKKLSILEYEKYLNETKIEKETNSEPKKMVQKENGSKRKGRPKKRG